MIIKGNLASVVTALFAMSVVSPSLALAQSGCDEQIIVPSNATCSDFYQQRKSWDEEKIRKCGLTQVDAYKRALDISDQRWADFLKPCGDSTSLGTADPASSCTVMVTMAGQYGRYGDEVGIFESQSGKRGRFLSRKPFTTVRDHRERDGDYRRARLTLTPGTYVIWPTCGGRDRHGSFGCLVRPATREMTCREGQSYKLQFRADSAEY